MKPIALVLLISFQQIGQADVLLLPSTEVLFSNYEMRCAQAGYSCTTDYFMLRLKSHKTPRFDLLLDSIDLSSEKFRNEFRNKIIGILNAEDLNRMQLAMLIKLTQQINALEPTFILRSVQHELERIHFFIERQLKIPDSTRKDEFVFIFKEKFPIEKVDQLKTNFLRIPLYLIHYSSVPVKSDSFNFRRVIKKSLLKDSCGDSSLSYNVKTAKLCKRAPEAKSGADNKIIKVQRY